MLAHAISATVLGVEAVEVRVEVFISNGLPSFTVVGLPGAAVQESRERVRAALKHLGEGLPPSRIVVNLAPPTSARRAHRSTCPTLWRSLPPG